jgi:hypothetical protein
MIEKKYYTTSDLAKISGLLANELRYLIDKNNIEYTLIRGRKYFFKKDLSSILILAKKIYPHTKNQKTITNNLYKIENLIKKFSKLNLQITKLIKAT